MDFEEPILEETPDGDGEPEAPAEGGAKEEPKPKESGDRETRRELEQLKTRIDELAVSERHWASEYQKLATQSRKEEPAEETEPEDTTTPDQFVDELTSKGVKALYERGIPKKSDVVKLVKEMVASEFEAKVDARIQARVEKAEKDGKVLREFPELNDLEGQFTKDVIAKARELADGDQAVMNSPAILRAAAALVKSANGNGRKRQPDDFDDEFTPAQRHRAQGERGISRGEGGDEPLNSNVREMLRQLKLSEKDYLASKRQGRSA